MSNPIVTKLWDANTAPIHNDLSGSEIYENGVITNISTSEIYTYLPAKEKNTGLAIILCPGGGYGKISIDNEGHDFAKWLQTEGITGVVLKYRMPNQHAEVLVDDLKQAVKTVRLNSKDWSIDANKIGVAGFSAGGHIASLGATQFKDSDIKINFSMLFYPVVTMGELTHIASKTNFMGENPTSEDIYIYSSENHVNTSTPPTIILLSNDDPAVSPQNSIMYYNTLTSNNVPACMYIFPEGGHGWGMKKDFTYHDEMTALVKKWLNKLF